MCVLRRLAGWLNFFEVGLDVGRFLYMRRSVCHAHTLNDQYCLLKRP